MNRSDFQRLADLRLREAEALFASRAFEGAYYLAGYAVECALKACIAKRTREFEFPDRRLVERSYSHDLVQLLGVAGLKSELHEALAGDEALNLSWTELKKWSAESRYALDRTEEAAQNMLAAVGDATRGILTWLKKYW